MHEASRSARPVQWTRRTHNGTQVNSNGINLEDIQPIVENLFRIAVASMSSLQQDSAFGDVIGKRELLP